MVTALPSPCLSPLWESAYDHCAGVCFWHRGIQGWGLLAWGTSRICIFNKLSDEFPSPPALRVAGPQDKVTTLAWGLGPPLDTPPPRPPQTVLVSVMPLPTLQPCWVSHPCLTLPPSSLLLHLCILYAHCLQWPPLPLCFLVKIPIFPAPIRTN